MICYIKIELSDSEIFDLLRNGSTNQKQIANDIIKYDVYDEFFNIIEEIAINNSFELRSAINGGVLKIIEYEPEEIEFIEPENIHLKNNVYLYLE